MFAQHAFEARDTWCILGYYARGNWTLTDTGGGVISLTQTQPPAGECDMLLDQARYFHNSYIDTHDVLGGGAGKAYIGVPIETCADTDNCPFNAEANTNSGGTASFIDAAPAGFMTKLDIVAGLPIATFPKHELIEQRNKTGDLLAADNDLSSSALTSVNDLLLVPSGFGGRFYILNAKTMERLFSYDPVPDLVAEGITDDTFQLPQMNYNNPPMPVGRDIAMAVGENRFGASFPGRFIYIFSVPE